MGQVNSSQGPEGNHGTELFRRQVPEGRDKGLVSIPDLQDENKRQDRKTVHCVKNRIDMLIEDCLNIKEAAVVKTPNPQEENIDGKEREIKSEKEEKPKEELVKEEQKESDTDRTETQNDSKNSETSTTKEKDCTKLESDKDDQSSNKMILDNLKESNNKMVVTLSEESSEEKQSLIKKKTITTFQKFIDEVFDNSLHNMKEEEVKTASNFLKLCSDSLKSDSEKQSMPAQSNEPEKLKEDSQPKIEMPNTKKITLKDHIERFLEASFKEEMEDKTQGSNPAPKNLNIHMLVNDMITNGLKLTSPPTHQSKDIQRKAQAEQEMDKYQQVRGSPKRFSSHTEDLKGKVVVIDCDIDNDTASKERFVEKRQDKIQPSNSLSPNSVYFRTQVQSGQRLYPRENYKNNDASPKVDNGPLRHDPFDPRFADPKFQDNRIDFVPHEVNALSKREVQFNKRCIPRGDANVAYGSSHAVYQRSLHPQGPASPYVINSSAPSSYHPSDHYNTAARPTVYPGHHVDCKCPSCFPHSSQSVQRDQYVENQRHQRSPNRVTQHFSPSDPLGSSPRGSSNLFPNEQSSYMVRQSHSHAVSIGQTTYPQSSPKLVPQRPPIPAPSEHHRSLSNLDNVSGGNSHARHQGSYSEYQSQGQGQSQYLSSRHGDNPSLFTSEKYSRSVQEHLTHKTKIEFRNNHSLRPGAFPQKENFSTAYSQGIRHHPEQDISRTIKHVENLDTDAAPLDLSVKKPAVDFDQFSQTGFNGSQQSFQSSQTKLSPSLTFIKHLENSVDKYCQELMSPSSPTTFSRHMKPHLGSRSVSPTDRRSPVVRYSPLPSPHGLSPQGLYPPMLQGRSLPSPHYSGGITMGQPLVDKSQNPQQSQAEMYGVGVNQNMATVPAQQVPNSQPIVQGLGGFMAPTLTQINFDAAGKRNSNNVSKHEPIQNIIGNHDSNDILYLYCKVCNSTYGSLYGFRKHFRNQHGFEPRAEHTIVHTISGTKSALHIPASIPNEMVRQGERQIMANMLRNKTDDGLSNMKGHVLSNSDESKRSNVSPHLFSVTNRSSNKVDVAVKQKNNEQDEKSKTEQETKYLECPECGKTFQLNDFGSYKRHCRQHSHIKPFGCTDCHLSFADQRSLKEHFKVHVKESHSLDGNKSDSSNSTDMAKHNCSKCDKTFLTVAQLDTHTESAHYNKVQNSVKSEKDSGESRSKPDPVIAQTKDRYDNNAIPEMTQRILTTQSIVKQAAESMTAQACPDSSWDKADPKIRKNSEISLDNCDSGYSSSVGSNLSQLCSEDSSSTSDKKTGEKDSEIEGGVKLESNKSESSGENYEFFYKHKKFYHQRKRERSISSNSGDPIPNKVMKCSEVLPSSVGSIPVSSTTVNVNNDSCDSQCMDNKGFDVSKIDKAEVDEKIDKNVQDSDLINRVAMKSEARHNLPFVWDRTTRSRKTK